MCLSHVGPVNQIGATISLQEWGRAASQGDTRTQIMELALGMRIARSRSCHASGVLDGVLEGDEQRVGALPWKISENCATSYHRW